MRRQITAGIIAFATTVALASGTLAIAAAFIPSDQYGRDVSVQAIAVDAAQVVPTTPPLPEPRPSSSGSNNSDDDDDDDSKPAPPKQVTPKPPVPVSDDDDGDDDDSDDDDDDDD